LIRFDCEYPHSERDWLPITHDGFPVGNPRSDGAQAAGFAAASRRRISIAAWISVSACARCLSAASRMARSLSLPGRRSATLGSSGVRPDLAQVASARSQYVRRSLSGLWSAWAGSCRSEDVCAGGHERHGGEHEPVEMVRVEASGFEGVAVGVAAAAGSGPERGDEVFRASGAVSR